MKRKESRAAFKKYLSDAGIPDNEKEMKSTVCRVAASGSGNPKSN